MKSKIKLGMIALSILLMQTVFKAEAQNPNIPQALANIVQLQGKWEGAVTLVLNGSTYNFTYKMDFRRTADGSGMTMDETFQHPDLGVLKGSNLIGYNGNDDKLHWFSVDNFGTCHDHLGTWVTANHLYMEARETAGGQAFFEKIDLVIVSNNEITLTLEAYLDGQLFETITGTFQRH